MVSPPQRTAYDPNGIWRNALYSAFPNVLLIIAQVIVGASVKLLNKWLL
jgi:hypothetical protein